MFDAEPTDAELARAEHHRDDVVRRAHGIRRRRRRRSVVLATVAVLGLLVVVPVAWPGGGSEPGRVSTDSPSTRPTTAPTSSSPTAAPPPSTAPSTSRSPTTTVEERPTTTTGPAPTTPGRPRSEYAGVSFEVPDGWHVVPWRGDRCVEPIDARSSSFVGCSGLAVVAQTGSPAGDFASMTPGQLTFVPGSGMDCPFFVDGGGGVEGPALTADSLQPVDTGFRPVGALTADWAMWSAQCEGGPLHTVQTWLLPVSGVAFVAPYSQPQIAAILDSVRS